MVDAISGTGLDRVLSSRDQTIDRRQSIARAHAVANSRADAAAFDAAANRAQLRAESQVPSQEALAGRPRLGDLIRNSDTANQILDQTQSVDRAVRQDAARKAEQLIQANQANYFLRTYYLSYVTPGGDYNTLGARQSYKPVEDGFG